MPALARYVIHEWPRVSRDAAERLIAAFGAPDEAGPHFLSWDHPGDWRRVTVSRVFRGGPAAPIEWSVLLRLPLVSAAVVAAFEPGVLIDWRTGEVSTRRADEPAAILDVNLTAEVAAESLTPADARALRATQLAAFRRGEPAAFAERLRIGRPRGPSAVAQSLRGDAGRDILC